MDLDPKAQDFTQVWGLQISIPDLLQVDVDIITMQRFWKRISTLSSKSEFAYSGTFHGLLSNPKWGVNEEGSEIIRQLNKAVTESNSSNLSIRFVLDSFDKARMEGRIYGIIGRQGISSPSSSVLGRVLVSQNMTFYQDTPFVVDKDLNRVVFDFSGSLPLDKHGDLIQYKSEYFVIAFTKDLQEPTANLSCADQYEFIAKVPIGKVGWLENETGIVSVELDANKIKMLENRPVVLMKVNSIFIFILTFFKST